MENNRSWARGQKAVPHYPADAKMDAARTVRLVASRYISGRASEGDLTEAVAMWLDAGRLNVGPFGNANSAAPLEGTNDGD